MKYSFVSALLLAGCFSANAQVAFYDDCNLTSYLWQGQPMTSLTKLDSMYNGGQPRDRYTIIANGITNNVLSSIEITGDFTVTLYDDPNGSSANLYFRDYTKTVQCLSGDFDDVTSYTRVTRNAWGSNVATFYDEIDYMPTQGTAWANNGLGLTEGKYTTADLLARGISNDAISSMTIRPGYYVKVYEGDFSGQERLYKNSRANMGIDYFDNMTSSIEIGRVGSNGQLIRPIAGSANITEKLLYGEINIYPNPAKDYITVSNLKGSNRIAIFNVMGQQVLNVTSSDTKVGIDISTLAKGYYQVAIVETASNSKSVSKFVKN